MAVTDHSVDEGHIVRIEPDDRLVILARTIHATSIEAKAVLRGGATDFARFGETCLGGALYSHRSIYQSASDASVWSHFELAYFRNFIPADAVSELVVNPQPAGINLRRAEILLTTPSSFILQREWQGITAPEQIASLEFLQVQPTCLNEYRRAMQEYCGPAAAKLVRSNRFGTFRAMETAAVLYQNPDLEISWNQVHLCELNPDGFEGFGKEFEAALRRDLPDDAEFADTFAGLGRLRTVPRWTFNDPVVEADAAIAQAG